MRFYSFRVCGLCFLSSITIVVLSIGLTYVVCILKFVGKLDMISKIILFSAVRTFFIGFTLCLHMGDVILPGFTKLQFHFTRM